MRLITMGDAARKLGVDPNKIRRSLQIDKYGREYLLLDGIRLKVYRRGMMGNRYFDATEIAHQIVRRDRRQRLGS